MVDKFLVNGKPMTNEEYVLLLKQVREANKSYKETPQYKKDQEAKTKANEEVEANVKKVEDFCRTLKLSKLGIAKIALRIYNDNRDKKE